MKIVIVSDSHKNLDILKRIAELHSDADLFWHLGDSGLYPNEIKPFISVQGNCDYYNQYPPFRLITNKYGTFYLEHGHLSSRSESYALSKHVNFYLYGHTHIMEIKKIKNTYILNPGSISFPRDGSNGSYLILIWDKNNNLEIIPQYV